MVGINFYQIKKYKKENKIMIAYITELNSENFKMFTNNEFSLVDIWALVRKLLLMILMFLFLMDRGSYSFSIHFWIFIQLI